MPKFPVDAPKTKVVKALALLGDGGPPDETADEMIRAIRDWRDVPSTNS